jgi:SHS2 domain-containing protein
MEASDVGEPGSGFAFLDHTADIGIRAWGPSLPEAFAQAGLGLASLMGRDADAPGRQHPIRVEAADPAGLLVAFLDELLYLCETLQSEGIASVRVTAMTGDALDAVVEIAPVESTGEGLAVKAATYHDLEVAERADGLVRVRVYLDV